MVSEVIEFGLVSLVGPVSKESGDVEELCQSRASRYLAPFSHPRGQTGLPVEG